MTDEKKDVNSEKTIKKLSKNYWAISTVILSIALVSIIIIPYNITGNTIGEKEVGQKVLDFANSQGVNAELVSVNSDGQFYKVTLSMQGQEIPVYVTKDGENLIPDLIPLTIKTIQETPQKTPTPTEIPKSDKPIAELFIMTHCPYGTQAAKGFVPLLESFDKADAKIRFVHYFMHEPEKTETPRQVCIREEQSDKFLPYLREFLKEGNYEDALRVANINIEKMNECISSGKGEQYYNEDKALSESYGVRGSPALVINGAIAQSGRDSTSYLLTICSAFNNAPEECETLTLSSTAPSPMWGWDAPGTNSQNQC